MSVDKLIDKNRSLLVAENRQVMNCVLDCIKFLSCEMLAFWGSSPSKGKFMSLFHLVAKRDHSAAAYLVKIADARKTQAKMSVNLLSPRNIHLTLLTCKHMIVTTIVHEISIHKKACIIADSTQELCAT